MGMESFKPAESNQPEPEQVEEQKQPEQMVQHKKSGFFQFFDNLTGKVELDPKWKEVEQLAKDEGFNLKLVSDKEYMARKRPMPHGGTLYASGNTIHVRYERVSPERVREFIEQRKNPAA